MQKCFRLILYLKLIHDIPFYVMKPIVQNNEKERNEVPTI